MLKKILIISFIFLSSFLIADETEDIISSLIIQLEVSNDLIEDLDATIENNNKTISVLKNRIIDDQKEINYLRNELEKSIFNNYNYNLSAIVDYNFNNYRLNTILKFNLPVIPITIDTMISLSTDLKFSLGLGAGIDF